MRTVKDQEFLFAMPIWDYGDYARQCSDCYIACRLLEMALAGHSPFICDRQRRLRDACVGPNAQRWRSLSTSLTDVLLNIPGLGILFVRHVTDVKYVRRMRDVLRTNINFIATRETYLNVVCLFHSVYSI